ncbi:uracil phosphoribosyltransferase [Synechococcus sp. CCY 9618]|uniref:uracil phosphoribosyltransferase n=1 Tax=Synechococcus sp. CCY 9618 TaxID=2815602 RepID=UPI001C21DB7C|nr:uracil phosphoribosyltransferase [Synechococcus sp. CCY 9618]
MSMSLRVVVPPHPLIGHWLTLLRDRSTPSPLFATAMAELGRWLTYEALRDWLPHRQVTVETPLGTCDGQVVDPEVPLLVIPVLRGGLGLWQGAQSVLPSARVAHVGLEADSPGHQPHWFLDDLPAAIDPRCGVLVVLPALASGAILLALLERLQGLGVTGQRLRVITTLAAAPGLKVVGERHGDLTLYCSGIDAEIDGLNRIVPGFGDVSERLYGSAAATA